MTRHFFGYLSAITTAAGIAAAFWYGRLNRAERAKIDAMTAKLASDLFSKAFNQLSSDEAKHVLELTRRHFAA